MSVNFTTNINTGKTFGNSGVNDASAPTKAEPKHVNNNSGITDISEAENDFITTFSGTPKPSLREPEMPAERLAEQPVTLAPEVAKMLNLSTQPTVAEFITACVGKISDGIGKPAGDGKIGDAGASSKFDSEIMECLILLLTMDSKTALIQTLRNTLQAKTKDRAAKNQEYINKLAENDQKNAEQIKKVKEAEEKRKKWGILGAVFSAIASIFSAVLTVATFGAATPAAIAITTIAVTACAVTCVGSALTIAGLVTGNEDLQTAGMWTGIAGAVLSLGTGVVGMFTKIPEIVSKMVAVMKIVSVIANFTSGSTQSIFQIIDGFNQEDLAEAQKELDNLKIETTKLDREIKLLSEMIDQIADFIRRFMQDLLQDEEEVAQMVQQMLNAALGIEKNVKC